MFMDYQLMFQEFFRGTSMVWTRQKFHFKPAFSKFITADPTEILKFIYQKNSGRINGYTRPFRIGSTLYRVIAKEILPLQRRKEAERNEIFGAIVK